MAGMNCRRDANGDIGARVAGERVIKALPNARVSHERRKFKRPARNSRYRR
jgi:hypothetical protein